MSLGKPKLCTKFEVVSFSRWKARGQLPIRDNRTSFASCHGWDVKADIGRSRHFSVAGKVALNHCWHQKLVFLLHHSEDCMILSSFVWIGYQRVTDRRTDRETGGIAVANTALCIASNAAVLSNSARVIVKNKLTPFSWHGVDIKLTRTSLGKKHTVAALQGLSGSQKVSISYCNITATISINHQPQLNYSLITHTVSLFNNRDIIHSTKSI